MSLLISALIVILGDQAIKCVVFRWLENPTTVTSFLRFVHVTNPGVAFGIGKNLDPASAGRYFFVFLSLLVVAALLALFARYWRTRFWARVALGLIVGGAVSNLADRLMFGHVRDFIDFSFWWTFNGADLAICVGVVLLVVGMLKEEKRGKASSGMASPPSTPSSGGPG